MLFEPIITKRDLCPLASKGTRSTFWSKMFKLVAPMDLTHCEGDVAKISLRKCVSNAWVDPEPDTILYKYGFYPHLLVVVSLLAVK